MPFVSDWREIFNDVKEILADGKALFFNRMGGSDTDAVAQYLKSGEDEDCKLSTVALGHRDRVKLYNGYYDLCDREENYRSYLRELIDQYCRHSHIFLVGGKLLSIYLPDTIHHRLRLPVAEIPLRRGYQLLLDKVGEHVQIYPYGFVEKLASHPLTFMYALSETVRGKTVLVVSPFAKSIEANFPNRTKFFPAFDYPNFDLKLYNTPITYSGLPRQFYPHENWFETVESMRQDVSKMSFDIALLACGSYAMPLGDHIAAAMQKQAFYIGGILQMMFGVIGRRYDKPYFLDQINRDAFIYPLEGKTYLNHIVVQPETATEAFGAYF